MYRVTRGEQRTIFEIANELSQWFLEVGVLHGSAEDRVKEPIIITAGAVSNIFPGFIQHEKHGPQAGCWFKHFSQLTKIC